MKIHIAKAKGSVSSTVVIDGTLFKGNYHDAFPLLEEVHKEIGKNQTDFISKYAVIKKSVHPLYDIDYMFFQLIPENPIYFDVKGSCGHSILAAICVASEWGMISPLQPRSRVRVFVQNIGDSVVCEIDKTKTDYIECTAHFINNYNEKLGDMLPTGEVTNIVKSGGEEISISIVSAGNPYVFLNCMDLGISSEQELFEGGQDLLDNLQDIRNKASNLLGWDPNSVFPKIALIGGFDNNFLSIRAISVPSWHPTLALTGVSCLGVAAAIKNTVVNQLADKIIKNNFLNIKTKGGHTGVSCVTTGDTLEDFLKYSSIAHKEVRLVCPVKSSRGEFTWKLKQDQVLMV